jgi:O-antigen ligase
MADQPILPPSLVGADLGVTARPGNHGIRALFNRRQMLRLRKARRLRYWRHGWMAAIVLLALIAVRITELTPAIAVFRPVILSAVLLGTAFMLTSSTEVLRAAGRDAQLRLIVCYALWAFVMVPFAIYSSEAFMGAVYIFPNGLLLVIALLLCEPTPRNLDRILLGWVVAVALLAIVLVARGGSYVNNRLTTGAMYDPNDLAALLAMSFPIALGLALRSRPALRIATVLIAVAYVAVLAQTASRGGLVALAAGVVVFVAGLNPTRTLIVTALIVLGSLVLWEKGPPVFRERTETLFALEDDYNMSEETGRMHIWTRGLGYAIDYPITGVGMQNFAIAEGEFFARTSTREAWRPAHNTYVQGYAEFGLVGGTLLMAILAVAARRAYLLWRRRQPASVSSLGRRPELLASFAAFCLAALFLSHAYSYLLFAILGLIAFAHRVRSLEHQTPATSA